MNKAFLNADGVKILWKKVLTLQESVVNIFEEAFNTKADKVDTVLEGTPTAPTAEAGTISTQIATTEFVMTAIDNYYTDVMNVLGATDTDLIITEN
jgi:hypothetical protein